MTRAVWCVALWLVSAWRAAATSEPAAPWPTAAAILPAVHGAEQTEEWAPATAVHVIIGVKTSLVQGATSRRAIRETWGAVAASDETRVVFVGCAPDLTALNASDAERIQRDVADETQRYGDVLVHELVGCRDAYGDLANKVLAFFEWSAAQRRPRRAKTFVMVVDDDVYLRVDALLQLLRDPSVPAARFYGGQVWAIQHGRAMAPYREPPRHKYYLSYDQYPMNQLPPFANGPHYILSADVATFLGSHREMFHGVGGHRDGRDGAALDDVSVALWLLAMQIHPTHFPQFGNLRDSMCQNELIAFADVSVAALRRIHDNVMRHRSFCDGFSYASWLKRSPNEVAARAGDGESSPSGFSMTWHSEFEPSTEDVHVSLELKTSQSDESVRVSYAPAQASVFSVCEVAHTIAHRKSLISTVSMDAFCRPFFAALRLAASHRPRSRALYSLVLHNLQSDIVIPSLIVSVSSMPRSAKTVIECLLTQSFAGAEVLVFDEAARTGPRAAFRAPDIVFFAVKGGEMQALDEVIDVMNDKYPSSRLVLVLLSNHQVSIKSTRVIVLSLGGPLASPDDARWITIPAASVSFGATELYSPCDLLQPHQTRESLVAFRRDNSISVSFQSPRFCVDDYTRADECGLPHREYFSRLLNAMDTVDTVGECPGALRGGTNSTSRLAFDRQVDSYRNFKFVIAFEDSVQPIGRINDKFVAAFLAGAVPIFYGHPTSAPHAFNPLAYINCGAFASLRACASYVHVVHSSPRLYERMRREVPVSNTTAFVDMFSWHPDVLRLATESERVSTTTASQQLKMLLDQA